MLIAAYGSLKKGFYNHRALGEAEFLGKSSVKGVMYWNGSYPKLYKIGNKIDENLLATPFGEPDAREHELEIYDVDESSYRGIRAMELGAGYIEEDIETKWGAAKIYWMPHEHFSKSDRWIPGYTQELFD